MLRLKKIHEGSKLLHHTSAEGNHLIDSDYQTPYLELTRLLYEAAGLEHL